MSSPEIKAYTTITKPKFTKVSVVNLRTETKEKNLFGFQGHLRSSIRWRIVQMPSTASEFDPYPQETIADHLFKLNIS